MLFKNITEMIGDTPMLEISSDIHGLKNIEIYAKLELFNPFGSLKDRIAWGMLKENLEEVLKNDKTVIESSSGNTAKALQVLSTVHGLSFKSVTNRIKIPEVKSILQILGAQIEELPGLSECPDPTDPNDPVQFIENLMETEKDKYYHTSQYTNLTNPRSHFETTGAEIYKDIGSVDYFFATLGTTGSSRGVAEYLKKKNPDLEVFGIIATKGDNIPGIRNRDEMYEVGIFEKSYYDKILEVDSITAINSMLTLNQKCGVLGGPTSGAAFFSTLNYLKEIDDSLIERKKAVFIVCDRVEWYISYIQKRIPEIFDSGVSRLSVHSITSEDLEVVKAIPVKEASEWIESQNPIIIDLRGSFAYKTGHIKGSINITDSIFEEMIEHGVPFPKHKNVLLICPIGESSLRFAALLHKKKFLNVFSLEGGIINWRDEGMPLDRQRLG